MKVSENFCNLQSKFCWCWCKVFEFGKERQRINGNRGVTFWGDIGMVHPFPQPQKKDLFTGQNCLFCRANIFYQQIFLPNCNKKVGFACNMSTPKVK